MRNSILYNALGLLSLCFLGANLIWLPGMVLLLASMVFGYEPMAFTADDYYWWAAAMKPTVSIGQWHGVLGLYAIALISYVYPHSRRRVIRDS